MARKRMNLLRKDECEPLTNEQMNDIKSQFHPSNTANVNIVPYEIYDEDGEEIVIGEVRKTIDGVKKCKPLYRKIYTAENVSSWPSILGDVPANSSFVSGEGALLDSDGWIRFGNYYESSSIKIIWQITDTGKVALYLRGYTVLYAKFEYKYTKTTDTWENV